MTPAAEEQDEAAPPPMKLAGRLLRSALPWKKQIILGGLLSIAATTTGLVPAYLTMPLIDEVLIPWQAGDTSQTWRIPWILGGLGVTAFLAWALSWGRTLLLAWTSERIAADLRISTYTHLQRLSLSFYGRHRTGDLISRVGSDTDRICNFLSLHIIDFASDVLLIVMTATVLFTIDPVLACVSLLPLPLIVWIVQRARNRLGDLFDEGNRAWGRMASVLADTIPGIRVVKAFAQERREIGRFRGANHEVLAANDRVNRAWSLFGPLVALLTDLGLLVIWGFGVKAVLDGRITIGVLTVFIAYIGRFYSRLDSMSRLAAAFQRAASSARRVFEILDEVPDVADSPNPVRPGPLRGAIELEAAVLRHGTREVLSGVSLSIRPGEMLGLVGPSGAGKTTLVNLICRFYDPSSGRVLIDGHDARDLSLHDLRRSIGLVLQEPFLFYGTIAENIAYGKPEATREEIQAAAVAANVHDFIARLPDGYDSMVGERGQSLSGGERQRISIARALLVDPAILILDEATSSVDTETEREIQAAIDNLTRGRTTIAIAHRLTTLRQADRIIVLDRGRIVEEGPHDQLLAARGLYTRLYEAQFKDGRPVDSSPANGVAGPALPREDEPSALADADPGTDRSQSGGRDNKKVS